MSHGAVTEFESAFADWLGAERAFAFWKGRVAMYAILRAMGIGAGDDIIVTGYTCKAAVRPVKYVGATPVYVDIDPVTYCMDPRQIEPKLTARTRLIVAQHTYGYPADMEAIMDIAGAHGLPVVEDSCLALGSTYKGELCGTFGVASYFSFQWNKPFTTGIGGMVTTSSAELAGKLETLCSEELHRPAARPAAGLSAQRLAYRTLVYPRTTAFATNLFRWLTMKGLVVGSYSQSESQGDMPERFFTGMGASQARSGLRQMRKLQRNIAHRRQMQRTYDQLLGEAGWLVPKMPNAVDPVLVRYPVRVADKAQAVAEAPRKLIELGTWFECPLHPIQTPMGPYDYRDGMCPDAERAAREVVNLPTHPRANERTARASVEFIRRIGPA